MSTPQPLTVEHRDPAAELEWGRYLESGLPDLIRKYSLVNALLAFVESGLAKRLESGPATVAQLSTGLDARLAAGLLRFLSIREVVTASADATPVYSFTPRGRAFVADLAYSQIGFYLEAYGPIYDNMTALLLGQKKYPQDVKREGAALAKHCATSFHYFGTNVSMKGLAALGANSVLDLGCGSGGFLIDACKVNPSLRAIGIDISPEAIELARHDVKRAGLEDRIALYVGDAFSPETWPAACREVEAITLFGALHELFREGDDAVVRLLDKYHALTVTGPLKGLVVGEPELLYDQYDADFFLMHAFTNQGLPRPRDGWLPVLAKSKLRCDSILTAPDAGPRFAYYVLTPR